MRSRMSMHLLVAFLLAVSATVIQLGPMTQPAFADTPPPCDTAAAIRGDEWINILGQTYQCVFWGDPALDLTHWDIVVSPNGKKKNQMNSTSNPVSFQNMSVAFRPASGGGLMEGAQAIFDANGNPMSRPMRTRLVIKVFRPATATWELCHDTGWIDNGTRQWSHNSIDMGPSPDCGTGTYGSKVAGLYWSNTLGRWLGGN